MVVWGYSGLGKAQKKILRTIVATNDIQKRSETPPTWSAAGWVRLQVKESEEGPPVKKYGPLIKRGCVEVRDHKSTVPGMSCWQIRVTELGMIALETP